MPKPSSSGTCTEGWAYGARSLSCPYTVHGEGLLSALKNEQHVDRVVLISVMERHSKGCLSTLGCACGVSPAYIRS